LAFVIDVKSVIVMVTILGLTTNIPVLWHARQYIDLKDLKRAALIGLGYVFGIPPGTYLLVMLEPTIIKLAIAVVVIPFSILLLMGHSYRFKRDSLGCGVAGFISGTIGVITAIAGPPVALFMLNQGLVKQRFVATLAIYLLFADIVRASIYSFLGMVTTDLLIKIVVLLPALWLGSYLGIKMLGRINPSFFRRVVLSVVCTVALVTIVSVLMEW